MKFVLYLSLILGLFSCASPCSKEYAIDKARKTIQKKYFPDCEDESTYSYEILYNGKKMVVGSYKNGKMDGKFEKYPGHRIELGLYKEGKLEYSEFWDTTGTILQSHCKPVDDTTYYFENYYPNGKIQSKGNKVSGLHQVMDNMLIGEWAEYDSLNTFVYRGHYTKHLVNDTLFVEDEDTGEMMPLVIGEQRRIGWWYRENRKNGKIDSVYVTEKLRREKPLEECFDSFEKNQTK